MLLPSPQHPGMSACACYRCGGVDHPLATIPSGLADLPARASHQLVLRINRIKGAAMPSGKPSGRSAGTRINRIGRALLLILATLRIGGRTIQLRAIRGVHQLHPKKYRRMHGISAMVVTSLVFAFLLDAVFISSPL